MPREMLKSATWVFFQFAIVVSALSFQKPVYIWLALPVMFVIAVRLLKLESFSKFIRS